MAKRRHNRERATPNPAAGRSHPPPAHAAGSSDDGAWERQRVVSLVGHRGSGKTSLGDLLCKVSRVTRDVGAVESGTSLLDWTDEERRLSQSLQLAAVWMPWTPAVSPDDGRPSVEPEEGWTFQLLDAPGSDVLPHERDMALFASDGALLVVDATRGVEHGTSAALERIEALGRPAIGVITKVDRAIDVDSVVRSIEEASRRRVVLLQLPFADDEGSIAGVVDVLAGIVLRFDAEEAAYSPEPVPARLASRLARAREALAESVALCNDDLLEQYLEDLELPPEVVSAALQDAVTTGLILPLFLASVPLRLGAQPLLDAMGRWLPGPVSRVLHAADRYGEDVVVDPDGPFVASIVSGGFDREGQPYRLLRVWAGSPPRSGELVHGVDGRTARVRKWYRVRGPRRAVAGVIGPGALLATWDELPGRPGDTLTDGPMLALAAPAVPAPMTAWLLEADDEAKLGDAVRKLVDNDFGLSLLTDESTGGYLLAGASEGHLALAIRRLRDRYGVTAHTSLPPVAYREVPVGSVAEVEGLHVREDGDGLVEEYGRCRLALEPDAIEATIPVNCVETLRFDDAVEPDEDLPERWRPAIGEGAERALAHGPTAGYPVVGARVTLRGGAYDCMQSTDDHFRLAGENGVRSALERSGTRLLEPWWLVSIEVPADHLGELIGDVAAHRGRVIGMEVDGTTARLRAHCPYRELRTFSGRLQALTGGRGSFKAEPGHYEPLPESLVGEAIAESPFARSSKSPKPQKAQTTRAMRGRPSTRHS